MTELGRRAVKAGDDLVDFAKLFQIVKHLLQFPIKNRLKISFRCRSKIAYNRCVGGEPSLYVCDAAAAANSATANLAAETAATLENSLAQLKK